MGKLTEHELQRINLIKQDALECVSVLGELNYQKILIEEQIDLQKQKILQIKKDESSILSDLREKYGDVTINIENGEF